jgi:hypothetical protein
MPKRNKKELAEARAQLAASIDPETEVELARMQLALAKEDLIEYEAGIHGFANRVEMTANLIDLTRKDIARFKAIIAGALTPRNYSISLQDRSASFRFNAHGGAARFAPFVQNDIPTPDAPSFDFQGNYDYRVITSSFG